MLRDFKDKQKEGLKTGVLIGIAAMVGSFLNSIEGQKLSPPQLIGRVAVLIAVIGIVCFFVFRNKKRK